MEIAAWIGLGALSLSATAIVYRIFPTGFSQRLCDQKHLALSKELARQEKDRDEILVYLKRIEEKLDDHISKGLYQSSIMGGGR